MKQFDYKEFISKCFIMDAVETRDNSDKAKRAKEAYHAKKNGTYVRKRKY